MEDDKRKRQRQNVKAEAARRGVTIIPRGQCYLLCAPGVNLMVDDLADIGVRDLEPHYPRERDKE